MATKLSNALYDGQTSFERGVDTYRAPVRVPRNQCCLLINNTTRQDFVGPRPGWRQIALNFQGDSSLQTAFEQGLFQKWSGYKPDTGPAHLVFSVSGRLFRVDALAGGKVQEILLANNTSLNRPTNRPHVYFKQGELFLACQDGQSIPVFYWGSGARLSDVNGANGTDPDGKPLNEMPVGTCMEYSGGRFWVSLPDGGSYVAGDGVYGPTGTAAFNRRDAILRFTENNYLAGGQPFPVPSNLAPIRAMVALANLDTSLGQGPLQIFTATGAISVDAPLDRALWALLTNPIRTVSLIDKGALSDAGVALVNGDCWYRAEDGIRSFFIARRDFGSWGNHAMSYEVIRHLKNDDQALLEFCSEALFDNRLLVTSAPLSIATRGIIHRGLVILDFIPLTAVASGSASESFALEPPCWDGLWAGHDIFQIGTVNSQGLDHCFAAVLAPEDGNGIRKLQLWELRRNEFHDTALPNLVTRLSRVMEGPKLDFQARTEQKLLEGCEIWANHCRGLIDFTLLYRPDDYPCWLPWKHWQTCATIQRCAPSPPAACVSDLNLQEQYSTRVSALRPPDFTLPTGIPSRLCYYVQTRLEIIGECEIPTIKLVANRIVEPVFGTPLADQAECVEIVCCPPDDIVSGGGSSGGGGGGPTPDNPSDIGACCIGEACSVRTRGECAALGGTFLGKSTDCPGSPCAVTPPPPALPAWPIPTPYPCSGDAIWQPPQITDPITLLSAYAGIAPGGLDPLTYVATFGLPGCLEAWSASVWSAFLASGTPYAQARLVWVNALLTGKNYPGTVVYPNQAGGYIGIIDLNYFIGIEYCPQI